jgi:hypothetical protein
MISAHVEYENDTWISAFNMHLSMTSLFDYLTGWFGDEVSRREAISSESLADESSAPKPFYSVADLLKKTIKAICTWHSENGSIIATEFSFHILLHRFLALCIRNCCPYNGHIATLLHVKRYLEAESGRSICRSKDCRDLSWFSALCDYPLTNLATASQIKLKLWSRNGNCMLDQLMNYYDFPFCRVFRDLDLILVQVSY